MIEAVVTCVNYSDFLRTTLPYTLAAFDDVVIVTSVDDRKTQQLCAEYDVRCIKSIYHNEHPKTRSTFDKARLINHGLAHLGCDGFLCHLDADTLVPRAFKHWTQEYRLNKECLYGFDRFDCRGVDNWSKLQASGWLDHSRQWGYLIQPPPYCTPCARVGHADYGGHIIIGYCQLWHSSQQTRYPIKSTADSEHTDLLFSASWPREKRVLIGDLSLVHLSTKNKPGENNWGGRKSELWCPKPYPPCPPCPPKPYCDEVK